MLISGIDLSSNKLIGKIPHQIGNLTMLISLNLSYNNLTGLIPLEFSNRMVIESLDLSYNNLNGTIKVLKTGPDHPVGSVRPATGGKSSPIYIKNRYFDLNRIGPRLDRRNSVESRSNRS
ncbi:hypothetical protein Pint_14514 [Pistacia integerrima]|uniref:Uncharacterized protein n=1 Tax=Pistacia integerrima TaxID=434235 RepID=A0ACC0Y7A1_9ROSI|nr:hypothetical protein Pint_14514 [Pistacia integerrima]